MTWRVSATGGRTSARGIRSQVHHKGPATTRPRATSTPASSPPTTPRSVTDDLIITPPDGEDLELLRALAEVFDTTEKVFVCGDDGDAVALPESALAGLERLVSYLAAELAVTMKPYDEILTTREAAEPLGMSRPYLVHLIETEAARIPANKHGWTLTS
jgi:hypothetical protein